MGTDRDSLIKAWERATPPFAQRMKGIRTLRAADVFVIPTLSPFAFWDDLEGTLAEFQQLAVPYVTLLFFKTDGPSARTPKLFLNYLAAHHPELLDLGWQQEQVEGVVSIYGGGRTLLGKAGFASLARPHLVPLVDTELSS